ncbi:uncharacterized protein CLUP02_16657 [Colletotrichum lupini]|uniref:Uncharacterized protein n=1 Tax=Colletotrichum lupini TaxID=145971 RepID=A0A9Q8T8C1_9PEZI|nr:uncharacterized protein CLUP02_16657 [Colletotrichum lupini]UQC91123.1 hypothetical protein CLUP02_16657 [Colletotrichum lupini]
MFPRTRGSVGTGPDTTALFVPSSFSVPVEKKDYSGVSKEKALEQAIEDSHARTYLQIKCIAPGGQVHDFHFGTIFGGSSAYVTPTAHVHLMKAPPGATKLCLRGPAMVVRKLVGCLESSSDLTRHRLGSCDAGFSVLTVPTPTLARHCLENLNDKDFQAQGGDLGSGSVNFGMYRSYRYGYDWVQATKRPELLELDFYSICSFNGSRLLIVLSTPTLVSLWCHYVGLEIKQKAAPGSEHSLLRSLVITFLLRIAKAGHVTLLAGMMDTTLVRSADWLFTRASRVRSSTGERLFKRKLCSESLQESSGDCIFDNCTRASPANPLEKRQIVVQLFLLLQYYIILEILCLWQLLTDRKRCPRANAALLNPGCLCRLRSRVLAYSQTCKYSVLPETDVLIAPDVSGCTRNSDTVFGNRPCPLKCRKDDLRDAYHGPIRQRRPLRIRREMPLEAIASMTQVTLKVPYVPGCNIFLQCYCATFLVLLQEQLTTSEVAIPHIMNFGPLTDSLAIIDSTSQDNLQGQGRRSTNSHESCIRSSEIRACCGRSTLIPHNRAVAATAMNPPRYEYDCRLNHIHTAARTRPPQMDSGPEVLESSLHEREAECVGSADTGLGPPSTMQLNPPSTFRVAGGTTGRPSVPALSLHAVVMFLDGVRSLRWVPSRLDQIIQPTSHSRPSYISHNGGLAKHLQKHTHQINEGNRAPNEYTSQQP